MNDNDASTTEVINEVQPMGGEISEPGVIVVPDAEEVPIKNADIGGVENADQEKVPTQPDIEVISAPIEPSAAELPVLPVESIIVPNENTAEIVENANQVPTNPSQSGRLDQQQEIPATEVIEVVPEIPVAPIFERNPMEEAKKLDHDVLLAASKLIALERLGGMTEARLAKQKHEREELTEKILASISGRPKGAKLSIVAFECNTTLRTMADNLRRLRREGKVRATGMGRSRLYYLS